MVQSRYNRQLVKKLLIWTLFVISLWVVRSFESFFDIQLYKLGVFPRSVEGLIGIITSPFIHGDMAHLASNTLPLLFLGAGVIYFFEKISFRVIAGIFLLSNVLVWLFARETYHIGASGLIYGFAGFLLTAGIISNNKSMMSIAMLVTFFYGGMVWGLLPLENGISWEAHGAGLFSGILLMLLFRNHLPPKKKYQWEEDATQEKIGPAIDDYIEVLPPSRDK